MVRSLVSSTSVVIQSNTEECYNIIVVYAEFNEFNSYLEPEVD